MCRLKNGRIAFIGRLGILVFIVASLHDVTAKMLPLAIEKANFLFATGMSKGLA